MSSTDVLIFSQIVFKQGKERNLIETDKYNVQIAKFRKCHNSQKKHHNPEIPSVLNTSKMLN